MHSSYIQRLTPCDSVTLNGLSVIHLIISLIIHFAIVICLPMSSRVENKLTSFGVRHWSNEYSIGQAR